MYALELLIASHRDIIEQEEVLERLINQSSDTLSFAGGIIKLYRFFEEEVLNHMLIEAAVLFPVMKRALPPDKARIIDQLEFEHKGIYAKLQQFQALFEDNETTFPPEKKKTIIALSSEILRLTVPHSRREYEILPPLVTAFFKSENYKEVEDLYVKFSRK